LIIIVQVKYWGFVFNMPKAPEEIIKLVEKFERNYQAYKNPSFKEENIKQELGWN